MPNRISTVILKSFLWFVFSSCSDDPVATPELDVVAETDVSGDIVEQPPEGIARVLSGEFEMGSADTELCRTEGRESQHTVTITHNIVATVTSVTQAQFEDLLGYNPSLHTECADCPVERVNWHQAAAYCSALSEQEDLETCYQCTGSEQRTTCSVRSIFDEAAIYDCRGFRLPTEAEWEYLYRAGETASIYLGELAACTGSDAAADAIAWYSANSEETTHVVGQKEPNNWGLYDMAGNVWEWCHDRYEDDLGTADVTNPWGPSFSGFRVIRGGSFATDPGRLRASERSFAEPAASDGTVGVRCVRSYSN